MEQKTKVNISSFKKTFRLYKYVKPYWPAFSLGLLFLFLSSIANLAFPKLLGQLVDSGTGKQMAEAINHTGLLLIGILLAQGIFGYLRIILFVNVTEKSLASLRQHIYNHLIQLPMRFFSGRRVGELG